MQEALMITLVSIAGTLVLVSFFIILLVLFPGLVKKTSTAARKMHGRSVVLGVVNLAFFSIVALALNAIGEEGSIPFFRGLAFILLSLVLVGVSFGLAGMALMLGEEIVPDRSQIQQIAVGSGVMWFSSLTPYLGWFLLLPYLCLRGVGGLFLGVFRRSVSDKEIE